MRRKLIITAMISIILALGFTIDFACADVNDGLVGYYPFDGNANDDSGHGYHGLIHGNPDFVPGMKGDCISLSNPGSSYGDPGTEYVTVPYGSYFDFTDKLTISLWINIADFNRVNFVAKSYGHGDNRGYNFMINNGNNLNFLIGQGGGYTESIFTGGLGLQLNQWYHVAVTFDHSLPEDNVVFYLNGAAVYRYSTSLVIKPYPDNNLYIGGQKGEPYYRFVDGKLDEVRIYNRALSESEILELYDPPEDLKLHVLCIGVDYGKKLNGKADATAMYNTFKNLWPDIWSETNPTPLILDPDENFNLNKVTNAIKNFTNSIKANDFFIFYFSGHGVFPKGYGGDETKLWLSDWQLWNEYDEYLIVDRSKDTIVNLSDDRLMSLFNESPWNDVDKLFIIDACHSGGFWGDNNPSDKGDLEKLPRAALWPSTSERGVSYSDDVTGIGIWSKKFRTKLAYGMSIDEIYEAMQKENWEEYFNKNLPLRTTDFFPPEGMVLKFDLMNINSKLFSSSDFKMDFYVSETSDYIKSFVSRFYKLCLDREPDNAGIEGWVISLVDGSLAGADVANGFVFSNEFTAKPLTHEEFLLILYKAFFDRDPDDGGWNLWLAALYSGTSRQEVLNGFIYANEFAALCDQYGIKAYEGHITKSQGEAVEAFVTRFYRLCLDRDPDSGGLADWTNSLLTKVQTGADVATGFIFSNEFINQQTTNEEFLEILYETFFDREPDSGGWDGWLQELNNGRIRGEVLNGFIYSQEFIELCEEYGIKPYTSTSESSIKYMIHE